jgi:putative ABC transport system permease protein
MIKNYFKIAIRTFLRHKGFSLINIAGLTIGLACSILIFLFVIDELSYDRYHENADKIFRIAQDVKFNDTEIQAVVSGVSVGELMAKEVPEIKGFLRIYNANMDDADYVVSYENNFFSEPNVFYADSSIFEILSIPLIKGNPETALTAPNMLVITESIASKYFGNADPIGKVLTFNSDDEYIVNGVTQDCPQNSHFHFDFLASFLSLGIESTTSWLSNDSFYTYILLQENATPAQVENRFPALLRKYIAPELEERFGVSFDDIIEAGNRVRFYLQPLVDIHLHSHTVYEIEPNSNIIYVYIFSIIAAFILIIACVNFMNLSTAKSITRAKEVGIRKVLGAKRHELIRQFLAESVLLSLIALVIAMVAIEAILPAFNSFTGKQISLGYSEKLWLIPGFLVFAIIVGIFSGSYSAFFLSSFKSILVLKGKISTGNTDKWFKNSLVIFQFSISIILFICTSTIYKQLDYVQNKDLGFTKENLVVVQRLEALGEKIEAFNKELLKNHNVSCVCISDAVPGKMFGGLPLQIKDSESDKLFTPRILAADYNLINTLQLELKSGRFFSKEFASDTFAVVLNEAAVKEFNLSDPVGRQLTVGTGAEQISITVIGIVKDFNYRSLHEKITSLVLTHPQWRSMDYISVRINNENISETLTFIENKWNEFVPEQPFDYYFLDSDFEDLHKEEFITGQLFTIFSVLAIFIACLGLLGLASFTAEQRTKEIGIRKTLGASVTKVVYSLSIEFTKWVILANIIAWPIAYFFMKNWLQNFAYHTNITIWEFIFAAVIAFVIAILTVSFQAIKTANKNPVESLRYE